MLAKVDSQVQRVDREGGSWKGNSGHDVNELIAVIFLGGGGGGLCSAGRFWKTETYCRDVQNVPNYITDVHSRVT